MRGFSSYAWLGNFTLGFHCSACYPTPDILSVRCVADSVPIDESASIGSLGGQTHSVADLTVSSFPFIAESLNFQFIEQGDELIDFVSVHNNRYDNAYNAWYIYSTK
jgi:hypothetical protein